MSAQTNPVTVPANGLVPIDVVGEFVRCLSADGEFEFRLDGGSWSYMAPGISYRTPGIAGFQKIELRNKTGSDINVVLAYGRGEFSDDRLNILGGIVEVKQTAISIMDGGLITPIGSSFYVDYNQTAFVEIVSAATNLKGLIVCTAVLNAHTAGGEANLHIDGFQFLVGIHGTPSQNRTLDRPIFVPAGRSLWANVFGAPCGVVITYELLS